ncbi:hypothetical protein KIPB_010138, partial [Kipferlia bialata]
VAWPARWSVTDNEALFDKIQTLPETCPGGKDFIANYKSILSQTSLLPCPWLEEHYSEPRDKRLVDEGYTPRVMGDKLELRAYTLDRGTAYAVGMALVGTPVKTVVLRYRDMWKWQEGTVMLRAKASSQAVYSVSFSPRYSGVLTTGGQGHIKFWEMSDTFTGLKLTGEVGKFGLLDISDTHAFAELPGGIVLSGTDNGDLLLWDGNLVRLVLKRSDGTPCHDGSVDMVRLDTNSMLAADAVNNGRPFDVVVTAGRDGYIRVWSLEEVIQSQYFVFEGDGEGEARGSMIVEIVPVAEIAVGPTARVTSMARRDHLLLPGEMDEAG